MTYNNGITPLPNIHNTKLTSNPMVKRKTICDIAVIVTFIILSLALTGCYGKGSKPECRTFIGAAYFGRINLWIVPQEGEEVNLEAIEIIDNSRNSPTSLKQRSTEIMKDGVVKVTYSAPTVSPISCDVRLTDRDRFTSHFTLRNQASEIRFTCTFEYRYNDEPRPPLSYGDPHMILQEVTCGDFIYTRKNDSEEFPVEDIDIKLRLRDNKLEPVKP